MNTTPNWTVCYNIVSPESDVWVGTGHEFFNEESEAEAAYRRHILFGNCPTKRRYNRSDWSHLGVAHTFRQKCTK